MLERVQVMMMQEQVVQLVDERSDRPGPAPTPQIGFAVAHAHTP